MLKENGQRLQRPVKKAKPTGGFLKNHNPLPKSDHVAHLELLPLLIFDVVHPVVLWASLGLGGRGRKRLS